MIPQPDLSGLLTALVSAGLLTFAIVYVARSRRTVVDLDTPLSQAFAAGPAPCPKEMFCVEVPSGGRGGLGLLASIVLHLILVFGSPLLPYIFPEELHLDSRRYRVKLLEFRIPQPLFYSPPAQTQQPKPRVQARIVRAQAARPAARAALRRPPGVSSRPRFQLPESVRGKGRDVLIQPDQPPEIYAPLPRPLPRTFLWAQAPTPPQESRTVGSDPQFPVRPKPFALPHAQPDVRRPNRELAIGDLPVASAPILTFRPPRLPVPPANVSPVSVPLPDARALGELPATPLPPGSPMNLIAMLQNVAPPSSAYQVGVGNRLPESAEPGAGGGETPGTAQSNGAPGPGGAGSSSATGSASSSGPASAAAPAQGTHADLLATSSGAAAAAAPAPSASRPGADSSSPTGRLGIIIVQQTAAEGGLEGSEILTGQPVYTVYLDVPDSPRRWILQYCVPGSVIGSGIAQATETHIRIQPRKSIQPPYPIDRIPVDTTGVPASLRRLVLYGLITERGEIQNVRLIHGAGLPVDQVAVAALQRWTFRPASRGDTPVAVEALFGIPLQ